jgi:hypothetical protein
MGMKRVPLGVVATLLVAASSPALGSDRQPCKTWERCDVHLRLDTKVTRWHSPEVFSASRGVVAVAISPHISGRSVEIVWRGCRGAYSGRRVALRVNTCGRSTRLNVRGVSFGGKVGVRIAYRGVYRHQLTR